MEETSAYQPSMGRSSTLQTQAPRPPAASHPSSTSPHSAVDGFSLSAMKSIPDGKKIVPSENTKDSSGKEIKGGVLANQEIGNKDTDDVDIGFVPSFLEVGKQPRQKRYGVFALNTAYRNKCHRSKSVKIVRLSSASSRLIF